MTSDLLQMQGSEDLKSIKISFDDLKKNFPFKPRTGQTWVTEQIGKALENPKVRFIVIQAPTGSGKSAHAMSIVRSTDTAYLMTPRKGLQDQYKRDFNAYFKDLRGRANYACDKYAGHNCATAPCRLNPALRKECSGCQYKSALGQAASSDVTLFNFASALAFLNHTDKFPKRSVMVIDEAHMIEDELTGFIEFTVNLERLRKFGVLDQMASIPDFKTTAEYVEFLSGMVEISTHIYNKGESFGSPNDFDEFEKFHRSLDNIVSEVTDHPENLIMDKELDNFGNLAKITFRPFKVHRYGRDYLFNSAEKIFMLSATILNYPAFLRSLGISPDEAVFIDVASTFPPENRPILRAYVGTLNFSNLKSYMPKIIQSVSNIMVQHAGDKGIIHTPSYQMAQDIYDGLSKAHKARILFPKSAKEQADFLEAHTLDPEPTVLLSPSMAEGVDLKDDLSRFQIITKLMWPSTQDKVVKARMAGDSSWYGYKTCLKIVQAYGRSIRSETDWAMTYVLDEQFDRLIADNYKYLPKWFMEALSKNVIKV